MPSYTKHHVRQLLVIESLDRPPKFKELSSTKQLLVMQLQNVGLLRIELEDNLVYLTDEGHAVIENLVGIFNNNVIAP